MKIKLLKWVLILSGIFQIGYWGASHLFFPRWYLQSVGMSALAKNPGTAIVFLNEIGVLTIGIGIATILAAFDPVRNFAIILVLYAIGFGSMAVSLYHMMTGAMASGEWITVFLIAFQMVLLAVLFPWSRLKKEKVQNPI